MQVCLKEFLNVKWACYVHSSSLLLIITFHTVSISPLMQVVVVLNLQNPQLLFD